MKIDLTRSQLDCLMEFFELQFIPFIQADDMLDCIDYLVDMCDIYKKLKEAKGTKEQE